MLFAQNLNGKRKNAEPALFTYKTKHKKDNGAQHDLQRDADLATQAAIDLLAHNIGLRRYHHHCLQQTPFELIQAKPTEFQTAFKGDEE